MARPPDSAAELERIRRKADTFLRGLFAELEDLPEATVEWDQMGEYARDAYSYDWHAVLIDNDLRALEDWHRAGILSASQEERYRELRKELEEARPILERLRFRLPPAEELYG